MIDPAAILIPILLAAQAQPAEAAGDRVDTGGEETTAVEKAQTQDDDKIICKRTAITGSKFKKKICGTKRQWETLENRSSDAAREWQRRGKGLEPNDTNKPGT